MRGVTAGPALIVLFGVSACGGESVPQFTAPMTLGGNEVEASVLNTGARVYAMRCANCHGVDGSGRGPGSSGLVEKPRDFREADFRYTSAGDGSLPTDADLLATIRKGRVKNGMPAFPGLTETDQQAVAHYLKTFSPRWKEIPTEAKNP